MSQTAPILPKLCTNGNRLVESRLARQARKARLAGKGLTRHASRAPCPYLAPYRLGTLTAHRRYVIPTALAYRLGAWQQQSGMRVFPMKISRSLITPCLEFFGSWRGLAACALVCTTLLLWTPLVASAKSKPPRAPRPEPELKILDLKVSPNPYTISSGPLEFSTLVQLPKELDGASLLEVSSFITSPSKNSLRFLTRRTTLEPHQAATDNAPPPQVAVLLTWDGLDQKKVQAGAGLYQFEVRAKLLANGEKGPRTQMVSWPKRGTVEVK